MTALQLVDEVRTMTDAEQWLIVAAVALLVVSYTFWVGLAVVLLARSVVSAARFVTRKIRSRAAAIMGTAMGLARRRSPDRLVCTVAPAGLHSATGGDGNPW